MGRREVENEVRERCVRGTWAAEAYCAEPESYMGWSHITKCGDMVALHRS